MNTEKMNRASAEAAKQIKSGLIQGAVFSATGLPAAAQGLQCIHPQEKIMTPDSRFDMASVGKVFTASCCALLICEGKLAPDEPFVKYLPEASAALGRDCDIRVRDLAMHVSGFDNAKPYQTADMKSFEQELYRKRPVRPRLAAFEYACCNFILLGKIVNHLTGLDLDTFARKHIWEPLGMTRTQWNAPGDGPDEVEHWFPNRPAGQHNDTDCFNCPYPLGSGSCFSTAHDMMLFLQDMLERRTFPAEYYDLLMTPGFEQGSDRRSFGWDMSAENRPGGLTNRAIHHTGWSGQTVCVDPDIGFAAVCLTSRTGDHAEARNGRNRIITAMLRG